MRPLLTIFLPQLNRELVDSGAAELHCEFQLHDQPWQSATLEQLGKQMAGSAETAINIYLPGVNVLSSRVNVPRKQQKHLQRILPFLCEEQLATDIETSHIAAGPVSGEEVCICAIHKPLLAGLLALLEQCGLTPDLVTVETEPLRAILDPGQSLLWIDDHCCHLVLDRQVVSLQRSQLKYALETLQQTAAQSVIIYHHQDSASAEVKLVIEELKTRAIEVTEHDLSDPQMSSVQQLAGLQLTGGGNAPVTNLLQGAFASQKASARSVNWRPALIAAAVLLCLNLAYLVASGVYFTRQSDALHADSEQLYRDYFPDDKRIINIKTQTQGHLNRGQGYTQGGFLQLLGQFIVPWDEYRNQLTLKSLRFNLQRDELLMEIESRSIEQLDKLQLSLGEQAELLSANEDGKGVRGRIKLQGRLP